MKQVVLVLILCLFCIAVNAQGAAEVIYFAAPEKFPMAAVAVRASGEVVVNAQIDSDGLVISANSVSGHPLLRSASEQAALKWHFSKAFAASRKTDVRLIFDYKITERFIEKSENESELITENNHSSPFRVEVFAVRLIPKLLLLPRENGEIKAEICETHNQPMQVEIHEIIYSTSSSNENNGNGEDIENTDEFWRAREEFFPYANVETLGGYDGYEVKIKRKEVYFCPVCRIKREEWLKNNR